MGIQTIKSMLAYNQLSAFDDEAVDRKRLVSKEIYLGIPALDQAFKSVLPNDFVLIAAKTGSGKTELLTQVAMNAALAGKRVAFFALEASKHEIHRRIKFKLLTDIYKRETGDNTLSYAAWSRFAYDSKLAPYMDEARETFTVMAKYLNVFYREGDFNVRDFMKLYHTLAKDHSLVLADHAHFFTKDIKQTDSEHMRELALQMYDMANKFECPILMAAHLRKMDHEQKHPDESDIYGASELVKAATRILIICRGRYRADLNGFETVFRVPKNREDSPTAMQVLFDMGTKRYSEKFRQGQIINDEFVTHEELAQQVKR